MGCARGARWARLKAPKANGILLRDDSYEAHLPDDLQSMADDLRANRATADGHLLERVQARVADKPARRRRRLLTPRAVGPVTLALAAAFGVQPAHVHAA